MGWLFRILPSPTPRLDEHVSVWSIAARDAKTFFRIVGVLWLAAIVFAFYRKQDELPSGSGAGGLADQTWLDIGDFTFAVLAVPHSRRLRPRLWPGPTLRPWNNRLRSLALPETFVPWKVLAPSPLPLQSSRCCSPAR